MLWNSEKNTRQIFLTRRFFLIGGLVLIIGFIVFLFNFRLGINVMVVNNTDRFIERLTFGRTNDINDNLTLFDIAPNSTASGHKLMHLDGIAMFYMDDNLQDRLIPVGYLWGWYRQRYFLIIKIDEIDSAGMITIHRVFNIDTVGSRFQLIRMYMSLQLR